MSYSVRFYVTDKVSSDVMGEITNSAKNLGKFVDATSEKYFEFKTDVHLLTFPDDFVPIEFQRKIRTATNKVTLVTTNYGRFGIDGSDTRVPTQIGSSLISFEENKVMIVGKNLNLIIKAYLLFCKYDGYMPDFQEVKDKQKEQELREKWIAALSKNKELEEKLKKLTPKKPFWKIW